jgi:hypothetical protein
MCPIQWVPGVGGGRFFPQGIKWKGHEADDSPPGPRLRMVEVYLYLSYVFVVLN